MDSVTFFIERVLRKDVKEKLDKYTFSTLVRALLKKWIRGEIDVEKEMEEDRQSVAKVRTTILLKHRYTNESKKSA